MGRKKAAKPKCLHCPKTATCRGVCDNCRKRILYRLDDEVAVERGLMLPAWAPKDKLGERIREAAEGK